MKKQFGFGVVEIIVIILVIGLVGAVGWLAWDKLKPAQADDTTSDTSSSFLTLSDYGVRIPLNSVTDKLTLDKFGPTKYAPQYSAAGIFAPQLDDVWTCGYDAATYSGEEEPTEEVKAQMDKASLGSIAVTTDEEFQRAVGFPKPDYEKRVDSRTYGLTLTGTACFSDEEAFQAVADAFTEQFNKLETY